MNQTIRTFALVAAGLLAAALFLFALSLALGMALLGVIALFAACATRFARAPFVTSGAITRAKA